MQTLDMSLRVLYRKGMIGKEEVLSRALEPESILGKGEE